MPTELIASEARSIAQIIQAAVAPVFLLNGIAILLSVFAGRLARLVDRTRVIAERQRRGTATDAAKCLAQLALQRRRLAVVNWAIGLAALAAFLTCCAILALFIGGLANAASTTLPIALFALALLAIIAALALFLWEVRISGQALLLELAAELQPANHENTAMN